MRRRLAVYLFLAAHALCLANVTAAEQRIVAFPGAEGFGAWTRGGRGGRVVRVTNLDRRGPGSLSWAINEIPERRTIVFDVSGVIDCRNEISFRIDATNDEVTIAGETSPGGITIYNYRNFAIRDGAEQVILRFLRFRGTRIHTRNDPDCLLLWHAKDIMVDHCSFAGSCDETLDANDVENVTLQWTGFDESRKAEAHNDYFQNNGQWHNYGALCSQARNVTLHHCLFAHHSKRNPLVGQHSNVEAVNNVIYNYSNSQQTWGAAGAGLKLASCYFKLGPDRRKNPIPVRDNVTAIKGCVSRERDGSAGPPVDDLGDLGQLHLVTAETAETAYHRVLRHAGALPHDATSARMAEEARNGTGRQGYLGNLAADRAALSPSPAPQDSDRDGLPDTWERAHGLNPLDPADSRKASRSGYTYLELYCHACVARLLHQASSGVTP